MTFPGINLLPWRESRQLRRRRLFLVSLGVTVLLALMIVAGVYRQITSAVVRYEGRNERMSENIALLRQRAGEQRELLEDLQQQQRAFVRTRRLHLARVRQTRTLSTLLQTVSQSQGLSLDELHVEPSVVQISGSSISALRVSQWLRKLGAREDVATVELQALSLQPQRESDRRQDYVYRVQLAMRDAGVGQLVSGGDQ